MKQAGTQVGAPLRVQKEQSVLNMRRKSIEENFVKFTTPKETRNIRHPILEKKTSQEKVS